MIDTATKRRLIVLTEGTVGPFIEIADDQLAELCKILDDHTIPYSVQENVISFDGGPEIATVDLDLDADPEAIQAILDLAP